MRCGGSIRIVCLSSLRLLRLSSPRLCRRQYLVHGRRLTPYPEKVQAKCHADVWAATLGMRPVPDPRLSLRPFKPPIRDMSFGSVPVLRAPICRQEATQETQPVCLAGSRPTRAGFCIQLFSPVAPLACLAHRLHPRHSTTRHFPSAHSPSPSCFLSAWPIPLHVFWLESPR